MFEFIDDAKDFLADVLLEAEAGLNSGDMMIARSARVTYGLASILNLAMNGVTLPDRPKAEKVEESNAVPRFDAFTGEAITAPDPSIDTGL